MRASFGDCILDLDSRELLRAGRRVHLSGKAFEFLALLVRRRPRAVSKVELMDDLWPGTHVLESNLAGLAAEVRKAIGQAGRSGAIRTVQGFGYAFDVEVTEDRQPVLCHLLWSGGQMALGAGMFQVGRNPALDVLIDAPTVSWQHARLCVGGPPTAPTASVEDAGSRNGTFVNGQRTANLTALRDGDEIRLGSVTVRVRLAGSSRHATEPFD
jgi:DNA-binding winged helix-turn-helix (wHTH) protein